MKKAFILLSLVVAVVLLAGFGITVWEGVPPETAVFVDLNTRTYATRQCVFEHNTETEYVANESELSTPIGGTLGKAPVTVMTLGDVMNAPNSAGFRKDDACVRANGFLRRTGTLFSDLLGTALNVRAQ
jgi:hypothetical protein